MDFSSIDIVEILKYNLKNSGYSVFRQFELRL